MTASASGTQIASAPPPEGIPDCAFPGPFSVGAIAGWIKRQLDKSGQFQVFGEVWDLKKVGKGVRFQIRDGSGALNCSLSGSQFRRLVKLTGEEPDNGDTLVVAGRLSFYPGGGRSGNPSFALGVEDWRIVGEGEMLSHREKVAKQLEEEGLFERQKRLTLPQRPRVIGVVTSRNGDVRRDIRASLEKVGYDGTIVWAFTYVQHATAAAQIARALKELERRGDVETIIVARGGGSASDLNTFWDEYLCRTVAELTIPVITGVGHKPDHSLIDDVAHRDGFTPTDAASVAVPLPRRDEVAQLEQVSQRLRASARRMLVERLQRMERVLRAVHESLVEQCRQLETETQRRREAVRRKLGDEDAALLREVVGLSSSFSQRSRELAQLIDRLQRETAERRRRVSRALERHQAELDRMVRELAALDPHRDLDPGEVVVTDADGAIVIDPAQAAIGDELRIRFATGALVVTVADTQANPMSSEKRGEADG